MLGCLDNFFAAEFNGGGVRSNDVPMRKKVKGFGAIFGVLKKGITKRQNG